MISFRESTWTSKYTLSCWQQRFDCPKVHKHPSSLTDTCLPNLNPIWLRFARFVTTSFNTAAHTVSIIYIAYLCNDDKGVQAVWNTRAPCFTLGTLMQLERPFAASQLYHRLHGTQIIVTWEIWAQQPTTSVPAFAPISLGKLYIGNDQQTG